MSVIEAVSDSESLFRRPAVQSVQRPESGFRCRRRAVVGTWASRFQRIVLGAAHNLKRSGSVDILLLFYGRLEPLEVIGQAQ